MYERPEVPELQFTDAEGEPIPYGDRWGAGGPPEATYSRTRHPERFAPLIDHARALVDYLASTYDVDVTVTEGLPADAPVALARYEHGQVAVARTTSVVPRNSLAAPLHLAETTFPTVVLAVGAAGAERAPACGCDACDESLEGCIEELEHLVLAVADGRFQERYTWTDGIETSFAGAWGGQASRTPRQAASKESIEALKHGQRARHGERWQPWTRLEDLDRDPSPLGHERSRPRRIVDEDRVLRLLKERAARGFGRHRGTRSA
ncbi:DUF6226 family protein [Demequina pelophila]|uniref:DUF6226 family protein n=1 Tax=Demequina pelophila TaxID=1638984 RepID=UPI0007857363|nr:DUF6226 family protein [Demequina pelophila]